MAEKDNSENRTKLLIAIIGLIGIVLGTFGTVIVGKLQPHDPTGAKVQAIEGVLVFIRSRPTGSFKSLGVIQTNALGRTIANTKTKKRLGDVLEEIGKSAIDELPFENRLEAIVEAAKKSNPKIEGLIFPNDLTMCEQIIFNQ